MTMIRRYFGAVLFFAVTLFTTAQAADIEANLRQHENYLAADAREGRGIGTKGLDEAADYIAAEFKSIGLIPAFDTSYFQPFDMGWGVTLGPKNSLTLGTTTLDTSSGIMPIGFSSPGTVSAPLFFAGYGIIAPEYSYDDFAGVDVTGKILLCLTGEPGEFDTTSKFDGTNYTTHSGLRAKVGNAKLKGAIAILLVEGPVYASKDKEVLRVPRSDEPYADCGIPALRITREALVKLYPKFDLDALQRLIDGKSAPRSLEVDTNPLAISVDLTRKTVKVKNVVGVIPGDSSVIVIGAHYDHLGFGQSGTLETAPGLIHNGADDNASGVSSIIETARLLKEKPVKSTIVVASFTAEETGLGGSGHLAKNFPGGMSRVRAMFNLDMVGRIKDNKITLVGCKTAEQFAALVEEANKPVGLDVNCKGDGYGPSDNISFYLADKPVLFFFSGTHADYHKSSDDVDKINFPGMTKAVQLADNLTRQLDNYSPALTFVKTAEAPQSGGGSLRSSLGTVPDFSQPDSVKGYAIGDTKPNSAAANAGLQKGDIVIRMGKVQIGNIYDLMGGLRIYAPGDTVEIGYKRGNEEKTTRAVLGTSSR
jgi:hypothetical protein